MSLRGNLVLLAFLGLAAIIESHNYKVVITETTIQKLNKNFLKEEDTGVEVETYNKSFNVINGQIAVTDEIPRDSVITVNGYAKQENNEYKLVFTQDRQPFCQYIVTYEGCLTILTNFGNFPQECPIKPESYSINKGSLDENCLPTTLPDGKYWILTIEIKTKMGEIIVYIKITARIDR